MIKRDLDCQYIKIISTNWNSKWNRINRCSKTSILRWFSILRWKVWCPKFKIYYKKCFNFTWPFLLTNNILKSRWLIQSRSSKSLFIAELIRCFYTFLPKRKFANPVNLKKKVRKHKKGNKIDMIVHFMTNDSGYIKNRRFHYYF